MKYHIFPASLKEMIKNGIAKHLPSIWEIIHSANIYWYFRKKYRKKQNFYFNKIYKNGCAEVLSGPFAGMKYANFISWGPLMSRWLGSYEQELAPLIKGFSTLKYDKIIDIGSAEGYYAVGLARKLKDSHIFAFDKDPRARFFCRLLAIKNRVRNLTVSGDCSAAAIKQLSGPRTAIICDIEGHELPLFLSIKPDELARTDILIEVHPFKDDSEQEVGELISNHFQDTHVSHKIPVQPRKISEFAQKFALTEDEARTCLAEDRIESQFWLWLKTKKH